MSKIANKQMICEVLMDAAKTDRDIVALCSDSRGSGSFTPFADTYPEQFIETGIAEQNLVSISAGLAKCGKKPYAASPACFLSTRSYEQCKVDVAYSNTNVKLIGISGGVSYGALGMSHHSAQDIAAMSAIPNMRVYLPSDRFQTEKLTEALLKDEKPFMRVMAEQENTSVCETSPVRLKRPKPQLKRLPNLGLPDSTSITTMKESAVGRMATGRQLAKELLNMGSSSIRCVSIWKSISIR